MSFLHLFLLHITKIDKLLLTTKKTRGRKDIVKTLRESDLSIPTLNIALIPLFSLPEDSAQ